MRVRAPPLLILCPIVDPLSRTPRPPRHAEKAADAEHLREVLAREAEAAARDGDAAARRKAETLAHRAQLESQMGLAAEETAWMDRHFAEEHEREWARRQAKWDAEAAARRALQADVTAVRGHQVQDRARARAEEEARDAAQVAAWREQQAAAAARDAAAQADIVGVLRAAVRPAPAPAPRADAAHVPPK